MPYKVTKNGSEWCVEKEDGKRIGCHPSKAKAEAQMRALYANEHKSLSDLKLELHREFSKILDKVDSYEAGNAETTKTILAGEGEEQNSFSWDIEDGTITEGTSNSVTVIPIPDGTYSVNIGVDDHPEPETIYAAPTSNDPGLLKSLTGKFQKGLKPGQSVFKAADGQRLMVITTSNSYQDREDETLTTDALKSDVDRHWTGEDAEFMSNNPLLFWHEDDAPVGDIIWADMIGPFYVELARERKDVISKRYFDWRESHPDEKWGASHRFAYFTNHRNSGGDYSRIYKQESTTLPLEAAANLGTLSGVLPMNDKRAKKFDEIMGLDGAYDTLKTEGYDALVRKLQAQGIEHKTIDETAQDVTEKMSKDFAQYIVDMAEDVATLSEDVEKAVAATETAQKSYEDKETKLDETVQRFEDAIKSVSDLAEKLQERLDARPTRASRSKDTEIEDGALPADVADSLLVDDPVFGKVKPVRS